MNIKRPDLYRTEQFNKWFNNLKDHVAKSAIRTRLTRMASGHFGDCKKIGNISEARVMLALDIESTLRLRDDRFFCY